MTFTRIKNPLVFTNSNNNNTSITSLSSIRDLGFILTLTLSPYLHIENVCCKVLKTLSFINRVTNDFKLLIPLKALYYDFVRLILEYSSILWDPSATTISRQLERVQRKFL